VVAIGIHTNTTLLALRSILAWILASILVSILASILASSLALSLASIPCFVADVANTKCRGCGRSRFRFFDFALI
jgi:hypothetical protein